MCLLLSFSLPKDFDKLRSTGDLLQPPGPKTTSKPSSKLLLGLSKQLCLSARRRLWLCPLGAGHGRAFASGGGHGLQSGWGAGELVGGQPCRCHNDTHEKIRALYDLYDDVMM